MLCSKRMFQKRIRSMSELPGGGRMEAGDRRPGGSDEQELPTLQKREMRSRSQEWHVGGMEVRDTMKRHWRNEGFPWLHICLRKNKNKNVHVNVCSSFIYNHQKLKGTRRPSTSVG